MTELRIELNDALYARISQMAAEHDKTPGEIVEEHIAQWLKPKPVTDDKLHGIWSFLGMYAGEHVAGTEFVIGPLFVVHGVTAINLFLGLMIGNLLAVASWAFLCAPIAVKT